MHGESHDPRRPCVWQESAGGNAWVKGTSCVAPLFSLCAPLAALEPVSTIDECTKDAACGTNARQRAAEQLDLSCIRRGTMRACVQAHDDGCDGLANSPAMS